ncbi:hypothetical protein FLW53_26310 [Microbispora sp. SCL1-1]|uniref:hypothetical protein n=1 Tax=Microbispora TaxID=2005 RepID=UPI0011586A25|nr:MULTISPECIES: hypothetical protein [unclassified Microbispora]NJP27661.1 hypothetical protein [Microbispora sp. CL1-1]TQS10902.1 hypothetical protein FLW53_26310 [Microbispora sp. SCL1-1]
MTGALRLLTDAGVRAGVDVPSSVGSTAPNWRGASDSDPASVERADKVVSDSPEQAVAGNRPWFPALVPDALGAVVAGRHVARTGDDEVTLCRSTGLAGSEVVLADPLLDRIDRSRSRSGLGESHAPVR